MIVLGNLHCDKCGFEIIKPFKDEEKTEVHRDECPSFEVASAARLDWVSTSWGKSFDDRS